MKSDSGRAMAEDVTEGESIFPSTHQPFELVRALLDALDQCSSTVILTTPDGIIRYVNRHFSKLTGYPAEEAIGMTPRILRSGNTPKEFYRTMWSTILAGDEFRGEIQNRRKSGELYWENLSVTPIRGASGDTSFFLAIADNITARKRLEKELHESLDRLTDSNAKLQHFVSMVSHDLQGPLGNVSMALDYLADDRESPLAAGTRDVLDAARTSLNDAVTLLRELLSYSRASRREWEAVPIDLNLLVTELSEALYREIAATGARITCAELPTIRGNSTLIRELFYNLIANAIKYRGQQKPDITIRSQAADDGLTVVIEDNGMGIPPGELERVVEPFSRGSNAYAIPGTGLGLALCKQIMEVHRGTLRLRSVVGNGTEVTLFFPSAQRP